MSQDISGPTGFTKSMSVRDKSSVDAMLREGKDLVRMKQQLARTVQAGEQILSRLVAVRTEDKVKEKGVMATLTRREAKGKHTTTRLVVLNPPVHAAVEAFLNDSASATVLREGPVEVMGKKNVARKQWLVLTETHLEFRESQEKKVALKRMTLISSCCERLPAQSLELINLKKDHQLVFSSAEETDMWLLEFAKARVRCASLCLDLVPMFRSLILTKGGDNLAVAASSGHERTPSTAMAGRGQRMLASDMRFAHLAFEKVNVSYQIALELHDTYVADVERRLERLDTLAAERAASRQRIAELESEMGVEERMSQKAGRDLSDTFGHVLENVGILHEALSEKHKDLRLISAASFTEEQASSIEMFREALDILDVGLMMDRPLKQQIHELELREAEATSEVAQLAAKKEELNAMLEKVRNKRELLESVTNVSGKLSSSVEAAAKTVSETGKEKLDLGQIVCFAPIVREAASQLPGMKPAPVKVEAEHPDLLDVMGGGAASAAANAEDGSSEEEKDYSPTAILNRLFLSPNAEAEQAVLRCFEYFIKPLLLMEHVTLTYCEGPKVSHNAKEVEAIEKRMASVRLRGLNFLRKWVRTHPYHFADPQMKKLLSTFLRCAKVTGHEKLATLIEGDMETATGESMRALFDAAPAVVGISLGDSEKTVKRLVELNPQELARQLTLLDHDFYRKIEHRELVRNNFMKKRSPHVAEFSAHFNHVASVVAASILTAPSDHAGALSFWLQVLQLSNSSVTRLKRAWSDVQLAPYFEECKQLMDKNFAALRHELESAARPVIPYLGFYQRDLVYLEEAPTFKGTNVNMGKLVSISNVIGNCLQYQTSMYAWFMSSETISNMVLQHRILEEKEAHELSLKIEPRGGAGASGAVPELTLPEDIKKDGSKTLKLSKSVRASSKPSAADAVVSGSSDGSSDSVPNASRKFVSRTRTHSIPPSGPSPTTTPSPSASSPAPAPPVVETSPLPREASQKAQRLLGADSGSANGSPRDVSPRSSKLLGKPLPVAPGEARHRSPGASRKSSGSGESTVSKE